MIFQLESELSKLQEENSTVIDMLNDEKVRIKVFNESSKKTVEEKSNLISKTEDLEKSFHSMKLNYEQEIMNKWPWNFHKGEKCSYKRKTEERQAD